MDTWDSSDSGKHGSKSNIAGLCTAPHSRRCPKPLISPFLTPISIADHDLRDQHKLASYRAAEISTPETKSKIWTELRRPPLHQLGPATPPSVLLPPIYSFSIPLMSEPAFGTDPREPPKLHTQGKQTTLTYLNKALSS